MLGIDPGLTRCGLGVVSGQQRRQPKLVAVDVLRTASDAPLEQRLREVADGIEHAIRHHGVTAVAVEQVFAQHNLASVMATAQVAGLAMVTAARAGLPLATHTPSEVKAAVTGSGRAGKEQVQEMMRRILDLDERPRPADAADALALAVCHLWRGTNDDSPATEGMTPAQRAWQQAQRSASRSANTYARR